MLPEGSLEQNLRSALLSTELSHRHADESSFPMWETPVANEPRFEMVPADASRLIGPCRFSCLQSRLNDGVRLPGLKAALVRLVGRESMHPDPVMRNPGVFEYAYRKLFDAIPRAARRCRNCGGDHECP
jgi:hypothetical protein